MTEPGAVAGLLTHLHRDHADAAALDTALRWEAAVYEPVDYGGESRERLAIAQADQELHLGDRLIPIHYGGYDLPGVYEPVAHPLERLADAGARTSLMKLGETIEV